MANADWDKVREALQKEPTPEARKEAAEAFEQYRRVQLAKGRGSKPTLVSLGYKKTYPSAVPVDKIPGELERNPEFFELMKRIVK